MVAALCRANLSEAHLQETLFLNTNLTDVVGLNNCKHAGPSTDALALGAYLPETSQFGADRTLKWQTGWKEKSRA
jgi:hypothetical protein